MTLFNEYAWDLWAMWQLRSCIRVKERAKVRKKIDFVSKREIEKSFRSP